MNSERLLTLMPSMTAMLRIPHPAMLHSQFVLDQLPEFTGYVVTGFHGK